MLENRTEPMQEQTWWKLHCASCLLVFCAVVWCCWCWLRSEWGKKTIQTYPYSNCTFHHQSSQRKQTSFTVPTDLGKTLANIICCMCLFQHFGKQDRTHTRTNMVKIALRKLFAGILCGCVVLLVLVVKLVMKKTIQTHPYSNCIFHHQNSQRKQTSLKVPANLIQNFDQHNLLHVSLSACWKTGQNPYKNTHGEDCIAQVVCWYFVRLCGAAGVGCEVSDEKKIQTYPYSNCTFHHRNSQRVQTSFTVSTDLVKALTNIVYCTRFCHHVRKQDRIHARTNMVKTALRKLFAGILRGWMVLLVLLIGGEMNAGKKPSNHIQAIF